MNYLKARQRDDQRWDFTSTNDRITRAVGYCHAFHELDQSVPEEEREQHRANADKYHTTGHESEKEASECYKQYLLDNRLHLMHTDSNTQRKCRICGQWTDKYAVIGMTSIYFLCPEHNTREVVEQLYEAPVEIWSS